MRLHAGARPLRTRGVPNRIDDASWPFHHRRESILFFAARLVAASDSLCIAKLPSQGPMTLELRMRDCTHIAHLPPILLPR